MGVSKGKMRGLAATVSVLCLVLFAVLVLVGRAYAETLAPAASAQDSDSQATVTMYRLYNPNSGEHFYTGSADERDGLVKAGWSHEGTGWVSPEKSSSPVFRLYNPNAGDHHYTMSTQERDGLVKVGWNYEGIGWYSDDSKQVEVHRLYNPNALTASHHYTSAASERDNLAGLGWNKEGVGWYAVSGGTPLPTSYERAAAMRKTMNIHEAFYPQFDHGAKPAKYQKYIVLHDTEGGGSPATVVDWWLEQGGIAAHFIVGRDGQIWQVVNMDRIAHHAGYGNIGHNDKFGIYQDGRDDSTSVSPNPTYLPDHAMNSWSIGIEMVHMGGQNYPEAQLQALDRLIAYIDAYYGFQSEIIDHKMWRLYNSDTDANFAVYLNNYRTIRRHL